MGVLKKVRASISSDASLFATYVRSHACRYARMYCRLSSLYVSLAEINYKDSGVSILVTILLYRRPVVFAVRRRTLRDCDKHVELPHVRQLARCHAGARVNVQMGLVI